MVDFVWIISHLWCSLLFGLNIHGCCLQLDLPQVFEIRNWWSHTWWEFIFLIKEVFRDDRSPGWEVLVGREWEGGFTQGWQNLSLWKKKHETEQTLCPKAFPRSHTVLSCSCLLTRLGYPGHRWMGKRWGQCCSKSAHILFELVISSLRKKEGILWGQV